MIKDDPLSAFNLSFWLSGSFLKEKPFYGLHWIKLLQ